MFIYQRKERASSKLKTKQKLHNDKKKKKNPLQVTFNWVLWYIKYHGINA